MRKLYFITRSFSPQNTGGVHARLKQVDFLRKQGFKVVVVTVGRGNSTEVVNGHAISVLRFPSSALPRASMALERIGLMYDYLKCWEEKAFSFLQYIVTSEDIIFATTGGEAACLHLGVKLKNLSSAKLILSFHDPIAYTFVNGLRINNKFHVSRELLEREYIMSADAIITSSENFKNNLIRKYPAAKERIINAYFGFSTTHRRIKKKTTNLTIAYAGNFGNLQSPEMLLDAVQILTTQEQQQVRIVYIGDYKQNSQLRKKMKNLNVLLLPKMPQAKCNEYLMQNVDIGLVSLRGDYLSACCPSKLFDYLSLGIPVIGALPDGDCHDIINQYNFGLSYYWSDINSIADGIRSLINKPALLDVFSSNILKNRHIFSTDEQFQKIKPLL